MTALKHPSPRETRFSAEITNNLEVIAQRGADDGWLAPSFINTTFAKALLEIRRDLARHVVRVGS